MGVPNLMYPTRFAYRIDGTTRRIRRRGPSLGFLFFRQGRCRPLPNGSLCTIPESLHLFRTDGQPAVAGRLTSHPAGARGRRLRTHAADVAPSGAELQGAHGRCLRTHARPMRQWSNGVAAPIVGMGGTDGIVTDGRICRNRTWAPTDGRTAGDPGRTRPLLAHPRADVAPMGRRRGRPEGVNFPRYAKCPRNFFPGHLLSFSPSRSTAAQFPRAFSCACLLPRWQSS